MRISVNKLKNRDGKKLKALASIRFRDFPLETNWMTFGIYEDKGNVTVLPSKNPDCYWKLTKQSTESTIKKIIKIYKEMT